MSIFHSLYPTGLSGLRSKPALLLLCILAAFAVSAQTSKKDLENKKKKLQDDISYTNKLLNNASKKKNAGLKELTILKNKIGQRENLINTIKDEVNLLNNQITANQQSYDSLQTTLAKLKVEYAKVISYTYKNRNDQSTMGYLLAGEDFDKTYKRAKYSALYAAYKAKQARQIQIVQAQLISVNNQIVSDKSSKVVAINQNEKEKKLLTEDKKDQEKIVKDLQKTEANLKAQLKKKQTEAANLNSAIKKIIEADIKKTVAKAPVKTPAKPGEKPVKTPAKEPEITLTPEAKLTSQGFENNKGRLPWPVEKGFISSSYGTHPHPVLKGITVSNNGVDISTDKGSSARAVFDGEVSGIVSIPGAGQAIIIRHGEYLSVYSNLASVSVSKGSKIKTKQVIGSVMTSDEEGTVLHLEIWKGKTKLNPAGWIAAK